jgi:hypothetical protein
MTQGECEALVAFYNSTGGSTWKNHDFWLQTNDPCFVWYGVNCYDGGIQLELYSNNLNGSIPAQLGSLTRLTALQLAGNQLSGSIPPELGGLTRLAYLHLGNNQLSGSIPSELGGLANLTDLTLGSNQLIGSIPTSFGSLTNLTVLALNSNQLSGSIPAELGSLTKLGTLLLTGNQLSGSVPVQLGGLTNLATLDIDHNQLSGSLPVPLKYLAKLSSFYFNYTSLCEPAETAFQTWLGKILDLHRTAVCSTPFSISGKVTIGTPATGLADVSVTLGTNSTTTASDGSYTISGILPGTKGSLIASLPGYTFKPSSIAIAAMNVDLSARNFVATQTKFTISGKVTINGKTGLKGVTIATTSSSGDAVPNVVTSSSGSFSIPNLLSTYDYTVTPVLAGYSFDQPSIAFPDLLGSQTASFAATLLFENISGKVSGLGTTVIQIRYGPGKLQVVNTDGVSGSGTYSIPNLPQNVGYNLTPLSPVSPIFRFDLPSLMIPAGNGDTTSSDFVATLQVVMNGNVSVQGKAIKGVTVSAAGFSTLTDSRGHYSLWVPNNVSNMSLTATHSYYTFDPVTLQSLPTGDFNQSWSTAKVIVFGKISLNGTGLDNVVVLASAAKGTHNAQAITHNGGSYSLTMLATDTPNLASFIVTPALAGYTFSPRSVAVSTTAGHLKNFTAIPNKWSVSGVVLTSSLKGLSGVEIDATINGVARKVFSNSAGAYIFPGVPFGASFTLSAVKTGYTFTPPSIPVPMGNANLTVQNFTAN